MAMVPGAESLGRSICILSGGQGVVSFAVTLGHLRAERAGIEGYVALIEIELSRECRYP